MSFSVYFCMYAFRKPFAAASFEGQHFLNTSVALKTAYVISQVLGYTISKFLGVKVCSEVAPGRRATMLLGLVLIAEAALLAFAVVPPQWRVPAIFANGLPLGMVWGLVVWYLEGRLAGEVLLAGLSCSFIVASGVVKGIGADLVHLHGVSEQWMPAAVGGLFLLPFAASVWLLDQLPRPSAKDVAARAARRPMGAVDRRQFVGRFVGGMIPLLAAYFILTAYRDFRDNYAVEIYRGLKQNVDAEVFASSETLVAFCVMGALALLSLIRPNRAALIGAFCLMGGGLALVGVATMLFDRGLLNGYWWIVLVGVGAYLAYVPFGTVLFDRLIAYTAAPGTAVLGIYIADSIGYTGAVAVMLYKDLFQSQMDRVAFFRSFSYLLAIAGSAAMLASCALFLREGRPHPSANAPPVAPLAVGGD
jgi:MFS family permease